MKADSCDGHASNQGLLWLGGSVSTAPGPHGHMANQGAAATTQCMLLIDKGEKKKQTDIEIL